MQRNFKDPAYTRWRKAVMLRDGYRCKKCGKKRLALNAHHIKKWADFPTMRYMVNNGITLCYNCHKKMTGVEEAYEPLCKSLLLGGNALVQIQLLMRGIDDGEISDNPGHEGAEE